MRRREYFVIESLRNIDNELGFGIKAAAIYDQLKRRPTDSNKTIIFAARSSDTMKTQIAEFWLSEIREATRLLNCSALNQSTASCRLSTIQLHGEANIMDGK